MSDYFEVDKELIELRRQLIWAIWFDLKVLGYVGEEADFIRRKIERRKREPG